jgi:uncharacterized protein Yka (UPF0111/DUF47 family)
MTQIELHKRAIEILQTINLYRKTIRQLEQNLKKFLEPFNMATEKTKHDIDIQKRVIKRLLSRYNKTMVELNKF